MRRWRNHNILSYAEAHRWFQTVKHDRWYREQCPMTGVHLAAALQVSHAQANFMIRGVVNQDPTPRGGTSKMERGMSQKMLVKTEQVMRGVESGRLVFWRGGHAWISPPSGTHIFAQGSLVESRYWDYWRECRTCGGRKYLPIWMDGGGAERDQAWCACYRCCPPGQWSSFGARARDEFLAARVVPEIVSPYGARRPTQLALPEQTVRT